MTPGKEPTPPSGGGAGGQTGGRTAGQGTRCERCEALRPLEHYLARPGDVLVAAQGYQWRVYELGGGELVAVCWLAGHLLRRDSKGWWVADYDGSRRPIVGDVVSRLRGTGPEGWPLPPELAELAEVHRE